MAESDLDRSTGCINFANHGPRPGVGVMSQTGNACRVQWQGVFSQHSTKGTGDAVVAMVTDNVGRPGQ